jgi:hypothetical protein
MTFKVKRHQAEIELAEIDRRSIGSIYRLAEARKWPALN